MTPRPLRIKESLCTCRCTIAPRSHLLVSGPLNFSIPFSFALCQWTRLPRQFVAPLSPPPPGHTLIHLHSICCDESDLERGVWTQGRAAPCSSFYLLSRERTGGAGLLKASGSVGARVVLGLVIGVVAALSLGAKMGRLHLLYLDSGKIYSCKHCETHLALCEDIVSKSFNCKHGKAYLFNKVVNVSVGQKEERLMMTGMHTVADIFCVGCGSILGWKYEVAHEKSQKYKEGKLILERCKVTSPDCTHYCVSHEVQIGGSDADDA